jgi:hypothetical protein
MSVVYLRHRRPVDYGTTPGSTTITRRGRDLLRRFANNVMGVLGGTGDGAYTLSTSGTVEPAFANAGISASSVTTSFAATINGVAVSVTPSGGDAASCLLLANAINNSTNALVQGLVTASNLSATVTCASTVAGDTVTVCGFTFTATNGTTPSIVSGQNLFAFDASGANSADATNLAAAINSAPVLNHYVFAVPVAAVVRIFSRTAVWPSGPGVPGNTLTSSGSTVAVSGSSLASSGFVGICATYPGAQGNTMTIAASATGGTAAVLNTETRLNRGLGLANVLPITDEA